MKFILKKKIEGIDWEVGEVKETDSDGELTDRKYYVNPLDLHNLLLNGTIEKVEENKRWRAKEGEYFYVEISFPYGACVSCYRDSMRDADCYYFDSHNYFQTEAQAQAVADQIKELLIKSHQ